MHKTKIVNPPTRFLLDYFNIDLRSELPHINEICNGKQHVLKEVMRSLDVRPRQLSRVTGMNYETIRNIA